MKNIFNKFAFFIALSFVFISCGNLTTSENDDSIPQGKGKITISTDLQNGRSVLPTAIEETTTGLKWELVGTSGDKTYSKIWDDDTDEAGTVTVAYQSMTSDSKIVIDTGTWDFTLTASNTDGKNVLSATISATINAGENKLNFVMQEATGDKAATGSIEFTLNFPKDVVDKVEAKLFKYENNDTEISKQTLSIDSSSTDNYSSVKYSYPDATGTTSSPLSAGYYILKIELQQNVGVTTEDFKKINTYSCLIRVAPGLLSQGKYTLPDLAQLYTINYKLEGGKFNDSATTTSYNAYTSFELPEPTYQGYYFAGWYTRKSNADNTITETFFGNAGETITINKDITLYAKYVKAYTFNLYDSTGKEVENSYKVENGIGSVTLSNKGNSVWDYYLKSKLTDIEFTEKNNYKITVEMKAKEDSVVAIQAANADMFFTVGTEWTPCTMETGFIEKPLDSSRNGISFGIGLSEITYFRNLVIEPISSDDDGLPTLVFDITTEGINQYLNTQNKADKIIDVEKVTLADNKLGYSITINTPLSNNNLEQYVKLHLRDYAKSVGVNNVSFEVKNTGNYPFATSFMADTASNNSMAWNNVRTEVVSANSCNIDFPNYEANDELTVDVITGSDNVYSNYPVEFTISKFKVEEPVATSTPFANKIFAIQVGETWTQEKSVEVTIPVNGNKEFDVGMFNGWDSSQNMPYSFDDVTRFLYTDGTGNAYITDDLSYSVNNDNPNAPIFTITNESVEDKIVKITLNENYEVIIEDVSSIVTTWAELKYRIDNTSISEIEITKDLVPTIEIRIGRAIKISSQNNKTISRNQNYTGTFFIVPTASLELSNITLDGGNKNYINATGPLIWAESRSTSLTLTNCILQNNTIVNLENNPMYEQGGAVKTEQPFTMNGGSIIDCHGSNGGAVYTFANGSFTMNGGSISGCTATENGNAVYIGSGNLTLSGDAEITSDVYLSNGSPVTVAGDLTKDKVATIMLPAYNVDSPVITVADSSISLADQVGKFTLKNENYKISDDGRVAQNSGSNEPLEGTEVNSLSALQAAINGDDEVIIITSNITITDPLVINKKIKICTSDLNYQLARTTEGTVKGPMFEVTSDGELTLQNIIITGGYDSGYDDAENNPFIYNNGKTVIENSTLKNNYLWYTGEYKNIESKSIHFYGGGAIFSNGYLTINNSSMENFYINSSSYGGTIYIESGTCNIDGLTISSCSTNKNGAALYISENASSSTVNINNSRIVSNTADTNGGGIYAAAGTINIYNSEINSNSANSGKSVYFKKTVIYSINGNAQVTVTTTSGCNEDITPSTSSISIN